MIKKMFDSNQDMFNLNELSLCEHVNNNQIANAEITPHPTIIRLQKKYKTVNIPSELLSTNLSPKVVLNKEEVYDWYAEKLKRIKQKSYVKRKSDIHKGKEEQICKAGNTQTSSYKLGIDIEPHLKAQNSELNNIIPISSDDEEETTVVNNLPQLITFATIHEKYKKMGENDVVNLLYKRHCINESSQHSVGCGTYLPDSTVIWYRRDNVIVLKNLLSQLSFYNIPIVFKQNESISAAFEKHIPIKNASSVSDWSGIKAPLQVFPILKRKLLANSDEPPKKNLLALQAPPTTSSASSSSSGVNLQFLQGNVLNLNKIYLVTNNGAQPPSVIPNNVIYNNQQIINSFPTNSSYLMIQGNDLAKVTQTPQQTVTKPTDEANKTTSYIRVRDIKELLQ